MGVHQIVIDECICINKIKEGQAWADDEKVFLNTIVSDLVHPSPNPASWDCG